MVNPALRIARQIVWLRSIVSVELVLAWGLRGIPQAQDSLITLGQSRTVWPWVVAAISLAWLSMSAWFWSRFALDAHRRRDGAGLVDTRLLLWAPRLLGLFPIFAVAFALWRAAAGVPSGMQSLMGPGTSGAQRLMEAAGAAALLGFAAFVVACLRYRGSSAIERLGLAPQKGEWAVAACTLAAMAIVISAAGMILFGTIPVATGWAIQPLPTVLFAAAGLICGGTIINWAGARTEIPILALLAAGAVFLADMRDAGRMADNHDVRMVGGDLPARPDIAAAFRQFLARSAAAYPKPTPVPVVLVAASGGGLAAAFWTATILSDLSGSVPGFASQFFAASAVSGGALGALESVALMRDGATRRCGSMRVCVQAALGADFLAPLAGSLLYTDMMQRFLPVPVFSDREAALEASWEAQWRRATGDTALAGPFLDLTPAGHPWPALFLNGTSVLTGDRVVTSNLRLRSDDPNLSLTVEDVLQELGSDVPASTAAGNSARFPYISPIGVVRRYRPGGGGKIADLIGDGGYFENFGASTLLQVLDLLTEIARRDGVPVRFVVLQIIGSPPVPVPGLSGSFIPRAWTGPLVTLARTRDARGAAATRTLAHRVATLGGLYVPIRLGTSPTGRTAPLGWSLSGVAQDVIDAQWTPVCRARLAEEMALTPERVPAPRPYRQMITAAPCGAQEAMTP